MFQKRIEGRFLEEVSLRARGYIYFITYKPFTGQSWRNYYQVTTSHAGLIRLAKKVDKDKTAAGSNPREH